MNSLEARVVFALKSLFIVISCAFLLGYFFGWAVALVDTSGDMEAWRVGMIVGLIAAGAATLVGGIIAVVHIFDY